MFIDEIDTLGGNRKNPKSHSEDSKTLNAFLSNFDGFNNCDNFCIIGATNLIENLDPAFIRRFTKKIKINNPQMSQRLKIIKKIIKKKKIDPSVDLEYLSQLFSNMSSAEIDKLLNAALVIAIKDDRYVYNFLDIVQAFEEDISGYKKNLNLLDIDRKKTAYHEVGHLIGYRYLMDKNNTEIFTINVQERSKSLGYIYYFDKYECNKDLKFYKNEISIMFGGKISEFIFCDSQSFGAMSDLNKATTTARNLVYKGGFGENNKNFYIDQENISSESRTMLDNDIKNILIDSENVMRELIISKEDIIHQFVKLLLEFEVFYTEDINYIFDHLEEDSSEENYNNIRDYILIKRTSNNNAQ